MEKIRITKCTCPTWWYADKIGEEFEVLDTHPICRFQVPQTDDAEGVSSWVDIKDCEIIKSDEVDTETIRLIWSPPCGMELISMCNFRDRILICTTHGVYELMQTGADEYDAVKVQLGEVPDSA